MNLGGKSVLLNPFTYQGQVISAVSSDVFTHNAAAERGQNDKNNKMREAIIGAIINDRIPEQYYLTERWRALKSAVGGFLTQCFGSSGIGSGSGSGGGCYSRVECIPAAGRGYNYDFSVVFTSGEGAATTTTHHVEFKFNASKVSDTPQFVSPMKPSQYLSASYEEYFYDKYMARIANAASVSAPDRREWLKQIHNNTPVCVKHLQDKYYAGCAKSSQFTKDAHDIAFYELAKKLSAESIRGFISEHDLNIVKLSEYLRESQQGKTYMLFQPAATAVTEAVTVTEAASVGPTITLQRVDPADYNIVSCVKTPAKSRYDCVTQSGKKIRVLLRWKNGNGIAFPAFQIS
jgi:hypothetical protein